VDHPTAVVRGDPWPAPIAARRRATEDGSASARRGSPAAAGRRV